MNQAGVGLVNRAIAYGSQASAIGAAGLLEMFSDPTAQKSTREWLIEDKDAGFGVGLLAFIMFGAALGFQLWWLAVPLLVVAFALCWWFG